MHDHEQKNTTESDGAYEAHLPASGAFRGPFAPLVAQSSTSMSGHYTSIHRLLINATCKGGVGRSFFFINLADWFIELGQGFVFLDSDGCNGTLTRFFPDSHFLDLGTGDAATAEVMHAVGQSEVVAWDALGPMKGHLPEWIESRLLDETESKLSCRATMILMIEEDKDTVFQAGEAARRFGDRVDWLVVKNLKTCSTTEIYDNSKARQELQRLGAIEITMERVPWSLLATIQKTSRTLSSLVIDETLPFLERQRLRTFQRRFFEQLESARQLLLPVRVSATRAPRAPEESTTVSRPRVAPEEV